MKISTEDGSKMVLKDNQYRRFAAGIAFIVGGLAMTCLLWKHLLPLLVSLAFAAAGGFVFFTTKRVNIELDRSTGKIKICLKGFKHTEQREMALGDIQKVVLRKLVQTSFSSSSRGRSSAKTYYQFRLVLVTNQNEELPFDFGRVSAGLANLITSPDSKKREEAQRIANFIGAPLEASLPSATAVISAIKDGILGRAKA